jgi:hypothetical protein
LKTVVIILSALGLSVLAGCNGAARRQGPAVKDREFLTVDFQKPQTLRYKFVSSRNVELDWDPTKSVSKAADQKINKSSESMEMVVAYTPVDIDSYGLTTIKATCESVKARRSPLKGREKDAVQSLSGKTFTITLGPTGKIEDRSQLKELAFEVGEKAFRPRSKQGRIKEPDMIGDFIATQWFLWDSISSIEKASEGVAVGQSWTSQLSAPTPLLVRRARDVVYTLDEIRETEKGRLAVIKSVFTPAESVTREWPLPYSGSFQVAGTFGFMVRFVRGFKVTHLQGQGTELFNIDAGRTEQYNHQYRMQLDASAPSPLGIKPRITIEQKLSMQLLGN